MASRGILTLKMQRIQLSKIVCLSRMDLQVRNRMANDAD